MPNYSEGMAISSEGIANYSEGMAETSFFFNKKTEGKALKTTKISNKSTDCANTQGLSAAVTKQSNNNVYFKACANT